MPRKFTQEEAEAKSLAMGVRMVGIYVNSKVATEFECPRCLTIFKTQPDSVWQGHTGGCGCTRGLHRKLTEDMVAQRLQTHGFKYVSGYIGSHNQITVECFCGNTFVGCYTQLASGDIKSCGCLGNSTRRLSFDTIAAKALQYGFILCPEQNITTKAGKALFICPNCKRTALLWIGPIIYGRVQGCGQCQCQKNGVPISIAQQKVAEMIPHQTSLNFITYTSNDEKRVVDIACHTNKTRIAIEYDEWFNHGYKLDHDVHRLRQFQQDGWKTLHIKARKNIPTQQQLEKAMDDLIYTDARRRTITLPGWGKGDTREDVRKKVA